MPIRSLVEPVVVRRPLERRLEDHERVARLRRQERPLGRRTSPDAGHLAADRELEERETEDPLVERSRTIGILDPDRHVVQAAHRHRSTPSEDGPRFDADTSASRIARSWIRATTCANPPSASAACSVARFSSPAAW